MLTRVYKLMSWRQIWSTAPLCLLVLSTLIWTRPAQRTLASILCWFLFGHSTRSYYPPQPWRTWLSNSEVTNRLYCIRNEINWQTVCCKEKHRLFLGNRPINADSPTRYLCELQPVLIPLWTLDLLPADGDENTDNVVGRIKRGSIFLIHRRSVTLWHLCIIWGPSFPSPAVDA